MSFFSLAYVLFKALAAIPGIYDRLVDFAGGVVAWYAANAKREALVKIADAAAYASRASNEQERIEALNRWREALNSPRIK